MPDVIPPAAPASPGGPPVDARAALRLGRHGSSALDQLGRHGPGDLDQLAPPLPEPVDPFTATRHRARGPLVLRRLHADVAWPLAALVVVGLVGARFLVGQPLPDDGTLTAPAFELLRTDTQAAAAPLSPDGVGALHTAVYATATQAFERHATLVEAGRELLLVALVLSAFLLWRTARRVGLGNPACAVVVLAFGALPVLTPAQMASTPAALGVPWLLLAAWLLTGGRPAPAAGVLAAVAAAIATLLAPDVLLLGTAGLATALATGRLGTGWPANRRLTAALALAPPFVAVTLLLGTWDPEPASPARWGADTSGLLAVTLAFAVVGALAAAWSPRLRPPAVALVLTSLIAVAPSPGRLSALLVCLPVAALLLGALVQLAVRRVVDTPAAGRTRLPLAGGIAASLALAGGVAAAAVALDRAPTSDFGAGAQRQALAWIRDQVAGDEALVTDRELWAELVHAGADPEQLRVAGAASPVPASTPSIAPLEVVRGAIPPRPAQVIAQFDPAGVDSSAVRIVDVRPAAPTQETLDERRQLARALAANPTTAGSGRSMQVLESGDVDPRLLALLAGMEAQFAVGLADLPTVPGEEATGALTRIAVLDTVDGRPLAEDQPQVERLRAWLAAQRPPFLPDRVQWTDQGLRVSFHRAADPDALVKDATG